jgi:hypothetical protein
MQEISTNQTMPEISPFNFGRRPYLKTFAVEDDAHDWMRMMNRARRDNIYATIYVLVDGPSDDFAVVDIKTAIDMDAPYEWAI